MATQLHRVIGYKRVSTEQQGESGAGLDAQETAIRSECDRRGWELVEVYQDVASGSTRQRRPQLQAAIDVVAGGSAGTLMVHKLDRLSRSVADFAAITDEARRGGWNLVVIDLGVDLSTAAGEMVATIMATLAQWERRIISQRTIDALAARRRDGVQLGRPVGVDADTEGMILTLRRQGVGLRAIATELNRMHVPTAQDGATWHASTVRSILGRLERRNE